MNDSSTPAKICTKCHLNFPATREYFRIRKTGNLYSVCRSCEHIYKKKYKRDHPEKERERKRLYNQRHPETGKKYRETHKDQLRESNRKWEKNNPDKVKASRERQAIKRRAIATSKPKPEKTWNLYKKCTRGDQCINPNKDENGFLPNTKEYFYVADKKTGTLSSRCKMCIKRDADIYYSNNREKVNEQQRNHYRENPEVGREWKKNNPEKVKTSKKRYAEKHPDKRKAIKQRYLKRYPEKRKRIDQVHNQRRRANKNGLPNSFTVQDWAYALEYFKHQCPICGRRFDMFPLFEKFTAAADHWIPLSYKGEGNPGTVAWNIAPLCNGEGGCNQSKSGKMPDVWLREKFDEKTAIKIERKIHKYFKHVKNKNNS